jgi:para-nitrobenzyl esterase
VHLLYWDEEPLLEGLGSGTVDVVATLFANGDASQMYGSLVDEDLAVALQHLLVKFAAGDDLRMFPNEIKGIDALDWKAFPQALIVSDGSILCDTIEDRITQPKELLLNNTSEQAQP